MTKTEVYHWLLGELLDHARGEGCDWASPDCRFYVPYGGGQVRMYKPTAMECFHFPHPYRWSPYASLLLQLRHELKMPPQPELRLSFGD